MRIKVDYKRDNNFRIRKSKRKERIARWTKLTCHLT